MWFLTEYVVGRRCQRQRGWSIRSSILCQGSPSCRPKSQVERCAIFVVMGPCGKAARFISWFLAPLSVESLLSCLTTRFATKRILSPAEALQRPASCQIRTLKHMVSAVVYGRRMPQMPLPTQITTCLSWTGADQTIRLTPRSKFVLPTRDTMRSPRTGSLQLVSQKEMDCNSRCVGICIHQPCFILYGGPSEQSSSCRFRDNQ